jgi:hypothetical protein
LKETKTMLRMARPAHPGQFIRMEVIEPLATLRCLPTWLCASGRRSARRWTPFFVCKPLYEIAETRDREGDIKVKRYVATISQ